MALESWTSELVDLAAAQAAGDEAGMDAAFQCLRSAGREAEVEEALLQSYLFLGFPAAIESFRRWRMHRPEAPVAADEDQDLWAERGEGVCAVVYADHYEKLRANISALHPDLDRWMVEEGYGKVLGRPVLDLATREMLIVAMLVVTGARRQLRSHLRGALNAGVTRKQVEEVIRRAAAFAPPEHRALAEKLWAAVPNGG